MVPGRLSESPAVVVVPGDSSGSPDVCCQFQVTLVGPWMCVLVPDTLFEDRVI